MKKNSSSDLTFEIGEITAHIELKDGDVFPQHIIKLMEELNAALEKSLTSAICVPVHFPSPPPRPVVAPSRPIQEEIQAVLTPITPARLQADLLRLINHECHWEANPGSFYYRCVVCHKVISQIERRALPK